MTAINVIDLAQEDTRLSRVSSKEYAGPCPRCKSTDSFHVQPDRREGGAWMCRRCWDPSEKGWADSIQYLREFRDMSFPEAKAFLAGEIEDRLQRVHSLLDGPEPVAAIPDPEYGYPPGKQRQQQLSVYAEQAEHRLWLPAGRAALEYLLARGLTPETIHKAHLGYAAVEDATGTVPYIVIPWYDQALQAYWRISRRDIRPDVPPKKRYKSVQGSVNTGLYLSDSLKLARPVFLVEDEFSALSIAQVAGDLVSVVATGTTTGSRTPKWIARLACASVVFVAYDSDREGDRVAKDYWLRVLKHNALRWRPILKDANDMLKRGFNLRAWVQAGLDYISESQDAHEPQASQPVLIEAHQDGQAAPVSPEPPVEQAEPEVFTCSVCHVDLNSEDQDGYLDDSLVAYCSVHWQALQQRQQVGAFSSQEQFLEYVKLMASRLEESTGEPRTVEQDQRADSEQRQSGRQSRARDTLPAWLEPGSYGWNKQVERNGLQEMQARRRAWYEQQKASNQYV